MCSRKNWQSFKGHTHTHSKCFGCPNTQISMISKAPCGAQNIRNKTQEPWPHLLRYITILTLSPHFISMAISSYAHPNPLHHPAHPSVSFFHLSQQFNCFWEFLLCVVLFYKNVTLSFSADNVMRCQNSNVKLKCLNKSFILVITSVFYGRTQPGSIICPSPPRSHLSDEIVCNRQQNDVSDEVKQMCNEKISCNFTVRKQTFGKDGCPSIFKYIIIDYKCGKFGFFGMVYWCW